MTRLIVSGVNMVKATDDNWARSIFAGFVKSIDTSWDPFRVLVTIVCNKLTQFLIKKLGHIGPFQTQIILGFSQQLILCAYRRLHHAWFLLHALLLFVWHHDIQKAYTHYAFTSIMTSWYYNVKTLIRYELVEHLPL